VDSVDVRVRKGVHDLDAVARAPTRMVPSRHVTNACGLVLVLHGDTGSGLLMDAHVKMRELGAAAGYIVVAPSGPPFGGGSPGSTWRAAQDAILVDIVEQVRDVFRVDPAKIHVTGFSRGAFVTWRLLCDHSELFASVAPGGGGNGSGFGEMTCFSQNRTPTRMAPILFLMGRTDASVGYGSLTSIRDAAYETVANGPFGNAEGHCIPGSTTDPYAAQYAIPCVLPNAFVWGEAVLAFFIAHPKE
jgi:poly(3-hydroxybutyrate) depolymerase